MPASENLNKTRSFDRGNFIDVSTQNKFCGYYVLARRLINDNNCNILLSKFNEFYQTKWDNEQLAQVLDNMHPAQAEVMLGLVLQAQFPNKNPGLEVSELRELCTKYGYNLFISQEQLLPNNIKLSLFTSFQEYSRDKKEILVFFKTAVDVSELGHYYLVEPNNEKAARDARVRGTTQDAFTYTINNQGSNPEIFIENIKQSVTSINQQLATILSSEMATLDNLYVDKEISQIEHDEKFAWETALEEAKNITSKEKLNSFKQALFLNRAI